MGKEMDLNLHSLQPLLPELPDEVIAKVLLQEQTAAAQKLTFCDVYRQTRDLGTNTNAKEHNAELMPKERIKGQVGND